MLIIRGHGNTAVRLHSANLIGYCEFTFSLWNEIYCNVCNTLHLFTKKKKTVLLYLVI